MVLVFADVLLVQDLDKAGQTSIQIISISIIIMMIIVIIIIRIIISSWLNIANGQLCYTQRRRDNFPGTQFFLDKLLVLKKGLGQGIPKQLVELK